MRTYADPRPYFLEDPEPRSARNLTTPIATHAPVDQEKAPARAAARMTQGQRAKVVAVSKKAEELQASLAKLEEQLTGLAEELEALGIDVSELATNSEPGYSKPTPYFAMAGSTPGDHRS